jgi:hypothetical protein
MDGLYVVTIEALPEPGSDNAQSYGGAFINIYTTDQTESAALETAGREVADAGWRSRTVEGIEYVTREDFDDDAEDLAYFEQAQLDGIVLVVHTYPHGPDEDDVRH